MARGDRFEQKTRSKRSNEDRGFLKVRVSTEEISVYFEVAKEPVVTAANGNFDHHNHSRHIHLFWGHYLSQFVKRRNIPTYWA